MFGINKDGFVVHYAPQEKETTERLPAGIYNYNPPNMMPPIPPKFTPTTFCREEIIKLKGGVYDILDDYLDNFLAEPGKGHYDDMGLLYKTGILLYGPPGTGKTMLTYQIMDKLVESFDAVAIHNPHAQCLSDIITYIRKDDPDRLVILVSEEVEYDFHNYENNMLEFLDGSQSKPGVMFIGTTNYIQHIPDRIRNRPSRLNLVLEIPPPTLEQRVQLLEAKIPKKMQAIVDIKMLAEATDNMSLDHVKATLLYMTVHAKKLEESVGLVKGLGEKAANYTYKEVGFKPALKVAEK
jgi:SpoVK/Ycf46/Vps4 family AAA+-type ATPase